MGLKKKLKIGGLLALAFSLLFGAAYFFTPQIQVSAASAIFENQAFYASFNKPLKKASITNGQIHVVNEHGKRMNPELSLKQDNKLLVIQGLKAGSYTLHIAADAFKKEAKKETALTFSVVNELKAIESEEDLQKYFQAVLNEETAHGYEEEAEYSTADKAESKSTSDDTAGDHSATNNQVEGIEEGDIAVTDGKHIYSRRDQTVFITDAEKLAVVGKITVKDGYPSKLLLHEGRLLVFYDKYVETKTKRGHYAGTSMTQAVVYDVSNPAKPQVVREVGQEGYVVGIREYKDILYMVTDTSPNYWLLHEEEDIDLRPQLFDSEEKALKRASLDSIHIFPGSRETNYAIVSALDLRNAETGDFKVETYVGAGSSIYMSEEAIYMATPSYSPVGLESESADVARMSILPMWHNNTELYKFTIDGTEVDLAARTTVEGALLNQFSMDEFNGYFRIATTTGQASMREADSNNHLHIFDEDLKQVGKLTDLARGEKIYSVRFMGEKAYIVTFKETDPLFVIDVAEPTNPKVLGELKIPGFSNYLHPLDENHLIGIGYDTKMGVDEYTKQPVVYTMGMKVSLFDVSDVSKPTEVDHVIIGGRGTYSEVQHDHKALYRDKENGYYGFPITLYDDYVYKGTGAIIYRITPDGIASAKELVTDADGAQYEEWEAMVQRLLYSGDTMYVITSNKIGAYHRTTFEKLNETELK
ncbi:MAG: beta-propeller domain-containing protein [Lysinibacillus sp.]